MPSREAMPVSTGFLEKCIKYEIYVTCYGCVCFNFVSRNVFLCICVGGVCWCVGGRFMHVRQGLAEKMAAMSSPPRRLPRPQTKNPEDIWVENLSTHMVAIRQQMVGAGRDSAAVYYPEQLDDGDRSLLRTIGSKRSATDEQLIVVHSEDKRLGTFECGVISKGLFDVLANNSGGDIDSGAKK
jgi:hypothetical protein